MPRIIQIQITDEQDAAAVLVNRGSVETIIEARLSDLVLQGQQITQHQRDRKREQLPKPSKDLLDALEAQQAVALAAAIDAEIAKT